jgi:hypothetical protein
MSLEVTHDRLPLGPVLNADRLDSVQSAKCLPMRRSSTSQSCVTLALRLGYAELQHRRAHGEARTAAGDADERWTSRVEERSQQPADWDAREATLPQPALLLRASLLLQLTARSLLPHQAETRLQLNRRHPPRARFLALKLKQITEKSRRAARRAARKLFDRTAGSK